MYQIQSTEVTKEEILNNISKSGYLKPKFKEDKNITDYECYLKIYNKENCKYCNNESEFKSFKNGYNAICDSKECKKIYRKEMTEKTNMERYGVKNISQLQSIKDKVQKSIKKTNLERYGVENVFSSKEIMTDNNGNHKSQTKKVKENRTNTMIEKYGTPDPLSINNGRERGIHKCNSDITVKQKRINTCLERYGVENTFKSKIVQDKVKETMLERYGYTNIMFSEDFVNNEFAKACFERDLRRLNDIDENGLNSFERVVKNRLNDIDENGLNSYHRAMIKSKETNIKNKYWIADELKTDFEIYYRDVWKYTNRQDLKSLQNFHLRGHANKSMYHLDHKYSIYEGFKQNVPSEIIGNINNLEMIIGRNNISKGRKCSISLEELLKAYYEQ